MKTQEVNFEYLNLNVTFYIGKNAKENFEVINMAEPDDLWFHSKNGSSCHVVACTASIPELTKKEMDEIIKYGASLCKENTAKIASLHNVVIMYAYIKNVKKTKTLGCVQVEDSRIIIL